MFFKSLLKNIVLKKNWQPMHFMSFHVALIKTISMIKNIWLFFIIFILSRLKKNYNNREQNTSLYTYSMEIEQKNTDILGLIFFCWQ